MYHKFLIYQIKESVIETEPMKAFAGHDKIIDRFGSININDYEKVYSGEIEEDDIFEVLERLFYIFNFHRPEYFTGHSLSVGDIVKLDSTMWYCDSFGWKKLENLKY